MFRLVVSFVACSWLCTSCNAFDFDVQRSIDEVLIPGDRNAFEANLRVDPKIIAPQSWDQALPQKPSAIFVESFEIEVTDTGKANGSDADDFSWLERIVFFAESSRAGSLLGRHPIAWISRPGAQDYLVLKTNRALNLVPYLLEGLTVTSIVEGRVPEDDISIAGRARLSVDAL